MSPLTSSLLPAFVFLPLFLPCFTEDSQKGEKCRFSFSFSAFCSQHPARFPAFLFTFSSLSASCCQSPCICILFSFLLYPSFSSQTSGCFFPPPAPVSLSVCRVAFLTLPFLPALLSGVFQTFGAGQEAPGVACLSPPFTPIRSDTGTQSFDSSQQQLQED